MNSQAQFWSQFTAVGMAAILGTYFLVSLGNFITDLFRIYLAHRRARKFWTRMVDCIGPTQDGSRRNPYNLIIKRNDEPTKESEKT